MKDIISPIDILRMCMKWNITIEEYSREVDIDDVLKFLNVKFKFFVKSIKNINADLSKEGLGIHISYEPNIDPETITIYREIF
jgi:hypothetical protein